MTDQQPQDEPPPHLPSYDHLLQLHIAEYNAMRAEQRTRLDSATKFIQYYSAVAAASGAALVAASKDQAGKVLNLMGFLCLLFCAVTTLVALAQYYEESFVLRIALYFEEDLKTKISQSKDPRYWNWEKFHYQFKYPFFSRLAGLFRFGFLPLIAALGLGYAIYDWKHFPGSVLHQFPHLSFALFLIDLVLWLTAALTGTIGLSGRRLDQK